MTIKTFSCLYLQVFCILWILIKWGMGRYCKNLSRNSLLRTYRTKDFPKIWSSQLSFFFSFKQDSFQILLNTPTRPDTLTETLTHIYNKSTHFLGTVPSPLLGRGKSWVYSAKPEASQKGKCQWKGAIFGTTFKCVFMHTRSSA